VTIQYTPFKLVYGIQPIMLAKFVVPIKRVHNLLQEKLNKITKVRMEDLFKLDETHWQARKIIDHIQLLRKEQRDEKGRMTSFKEGELILWMPKVTKLREVNLHYLGKVLLKYKRCLITTLWNCQP